MENVDFREERQTVMKKKKTPREEYYREEIKKMLPQLETVEALKAVYEMTLICVENEKADRRTKADN